MKRLLICITCIFFAIGLASCAGTANVPSVEPSQTVAPTTQPSEAPSPTAEPTTEPTIDPTAEPTTEPTIDPTVEPTTEPTVSPTTSPSEEPTIAPTQEPTTVPTVTPTTQPSEEPSLPPSPSPTETPENPLTYDENTYLSLKSAMGNATFYPSVQNVRISSTKGYRSLTSEIVGDLSAEPYALKKVEEVLSACTAASNGANPTAVRYVKTASIRSGGYTISVNEDGITVYYGDGAGAFYSAFTLRQILQTVGETLPFMQITDYPDTEVRGFAIDMARNRTLTVAATKDLIDELAAMKLNYFYIYLNVENIECPLFAAAQTQGAGWTVSECKEVALYCKQNYIELIPFFELMGHCEELLASPAFRRFAEIPDSPWTLCLQDPETKKFVEDIVDMLVEAFDPQYLMMGGDESYDVGRGRSQEFMPGASVLEIYLDGLKTVYDILKARNIKMMFAHDMLVSHYLEGRRTIKKAFRDMPDAICFLWEYDIDDDFSCAEFLEEWDIEYWIMPSSNSFSSIAGRLTDAEINIDAAIRTVRDRNLPGIMMAHFGDGGQLNHTVVEYTAIAYMAGVSWNTAGCLGDTSAYLNYVADHVFGATPEVMRAWEELQRFNDLTGRSWGGSWLLRIERSYYFTDDELENWLRFCPGQGEERLLWCIERVEAIRTRAKAVTELLDAYPLTGKNGAAHEAEMRCTANMMYSYATDLLFRLKLYGGMADYADLREEATEMVAFNEALYDEFVATWKILSGNCGILGNSLRQLGCSFHLAADISEKYLAAEGEPLFLMNIDDLAASTEQDFTRIVPGYVWLGYGAGLPTVTICNIKSGSSNEIMKMFRDGSMRVVADQPGTQGKTFVLDTAAMVRNGHYNGTEAPADCLKPAVLFPGRFSGNGTYRFTMKVKVESGADVRSVMTTACIALRNRCVEPDKTVVYGEADEYGWVPVTVDIVNDRSLDYFSFGVNLMSSVQDALLVTELNCVKL